MIRAFLLLITVNVVCIVSYFIYNRMDSRFDSSEMSIKREMIEANREIENRLREEILEGREPDELITFRESWMTRLGEIKALGAEKKDIEKNFVSIIIPLSLSFKFALIEFLYSYPLAVFNGFTIYTCHVGWVFLMIACISISQTLARMNMCVNLVDYRGNDVKEKFIWPFKSFNRHFQTFTSRLVEELG